MTTLQLLIVCVTVLLIVSIHYEMAKRTPESENTPEAPPVPPPSLFDGLKLGTQVAVHQSEGQALKGAVAAVEPGYLVLTGVQLVTKGTPAEMGGRVRVAERPSVVVQEL